MLFVGHQPRNRLRVNRVHVSMSASTTHTVSRFKGALLGCFIGDVLGRAFEGATAGDASVARDLARRLDSGGTWNYSDDTEMMIGVAESVVRCEGVVAEDMLRTVANAFEPARGYGKGTRLTFEAYLRGTDA